MKQIPKSLPISWTLGVQQKHQKLNISQEKTIKNKEELGDLNNIGEEMDPIG